MADERPGSGTEPPRVDTSTVQRGESTDQPGDDFDEGRYLFCVVRRGDDADQPFTVEGIDGREADLVVAGDLAAVTQPCESLYDTSDPETVRRWLLRHQAVVDAAGEAFGTPLPFRFDTVIVGDDDDVREWIEANADAVHEALDGIAGRWEYRIEVTVEDEPEASSIAEGDDRLAELADEMEAADEGRAFLLEKQYDERLRELRRGERQARAEDLRTLVEPLADRVEWSDGPAVTLPDETSGDGVKTSADRPNASVTLALLATPGAAEQIGDELEAVADEPGVEVRYTGPWPPYTFAPAVHGGSGR